MSTDEPDPERESPKPEPERPDTMPSDEPGVTAPGAGHPVRLENGAVLGVNLSF
jgi:hypothetical protein